MDGEDKEKALKLVEYLKQLTALYSKVVYDLREYESVLWFCDVPKQTGCFTQAWGLSEDAPAVWLEIRKRREPAVPDAPKTCENWVNKETLFQSEELPSRMFVQPSSTTFMPIKRARWYTSSMWSP